MTRRERSWACPEFALRLRKQIRRGGPVILVMLLLCWMAGVRARGTVDAPALMVLAFSAGVGWALWGIVCLKEAVWLGAAAHDMTWGAYRRSPSRTEPDPGDENSAFLVGQMMRVEQRVSEFAAETGMAAVTFALAGGRVGFWEDASSVGAGDRGHVALGYRWLEPDRSAELPYILEHELAHLRRQEGRKRLVAGTVTVTAAALCAGQLPLADAALALGGIAVAWAAYQWWGELACDRAANNRCGRETAVACWQQELDRRRAVPPLRRWGFSLLGLISHPPTRLRLWMARGAAPDRKAGAPSAASTRRTPPATRGPGRPATATYEAFGGRYTLSQISRMSACAVTYTTLRNRLTDPDNPDRQWTSHEVEEAATLPAARGRRRTT